MPTSRAGSSARGFTLLEVLVVIAIMAVVAALALPRWLDAIAPSPEEELRPLARTLAELRWRAVFAGRPLRLRLFADHWQAAVRRRSEEGARRWMKTDEGGYPEGWRLVDARPRFAGAWAGEGKPPVAELVLAPTGAFAPLALVFAAKDARAELRLVPPPDPVHVEPVRAR